MNFLYLALKLTINPFIMKKLVFLIVSLFSFSFLHAQLPISFGPKVGFTTSKLSTDKDEIKESFKANFQGGAFLRLGRKTYLQPEVNFISKGGLFSKNEFMGAREIGLSTIEIPVLLGVRLLDLKLANIRVMAGPSMAFVIDKNIRMQDDLTSLQLTRDEILDKLEDVIWGVQAGAGIDLLMFTLDVRYEWGLNNVINHQNLELKNSIFNVSLGWKIL
jgi:hypothetical protein